MGLLQTSKGNQGSARAKGVGLWVLVSAMGLLTGCETQSLFDPSEMGQYSHTPKIVQILHNLNTGIDEPNDQYVNAEDVRPIDLKAVNTDYVIGRNDLVQVNISDLIQQNVETQKVSRVSESGFISLPWIGQVMAAGKTEAQLEQAITQAYKDKQLLPNAQVSVVTLEARNRSYTIGGAVQRPGQYQILDSDFRLKDAIVNAGGETSYTGIEFIYVHRRIEQDKRVSGETGAPLPAAPGTQPSPDILGPRSAAPARGPKVMQTSAQQPASMPGAEGRTVIINNQPVEIPPGGQFVPAGTPVTPAPEAPETAPRPPTSEKDFEFNSLKEPEDIRVIRVPFDKLKRGELKYNIVIRPMDYIEVPQPAVGEYYMGGHVQRTGVYSLTAREITLSGAVISAGMLDQLAVPERTEITRRISPTREVKARVNLAKIFGGEEPDIVLKPDDQIMVGTNAIAPFLASFRTAFRITYGFGFLYDRNYNTSNNNGG